MKCAVEAAPPPADAAAPRNAVLTLAFGEEISKHIDDVLIDKDNNELAIDAISPDGMDKVLDQEGWKSFVGRMITLSEGDAISCKLLQRPGTTMTSSFRG